MERTFLAAAALAASLVPSATQAHELEGYVSAKGVEFMETAIPTAMPEQFLFENVELGSLSCTSATIDNLAIGATIHQLEMEMPQDGIMRVHTNLDLVGDGEVDVDICFDDQACNVDFDLRNVDATIEFNVTVRDGHPVLEVFDVQLNATKDDVDASVSSCALAGAANWVLDKVKEKYLDKVLEAVVGFARDGMAPGVNQMLVGFNGYDGGIAQTQFSANLSGLNFYAEGMEMIGDVDLFSSAPAADCIGSDPGDPATQEGQPPLIDRSTSHMSMIANLGAVDDVFYHVWRTGLLCLNDKLLAARGIELDLEHEVGKMLPGFPAGTTFGLDINMDKPPRVTGSADGITLVVEGVNVRVAGHRPDGTTGTIDVEIDASVQASLSVDKSVNGVYLDFGHVALNRLAIADQIYATELGFDAGRLRQVLTERVIPHALEEIGKVPVTAPVAGAAGFYAILRNAQTSPGHMAVQVDMFVAPKNDTSAPNTELVSQPTGLVNPRTAVFAVNASDDQVPSELIQYVVSVDGKPRLPSFVRAHRVGEVGVTKTYSVSIAAMDLSGNTDPTPETAEVMVDGIVPGIGIVGERVVDVDGTSHSFSWIMNDDYSDASKMSARVDVYRVNDAMDPLANQLVESYEAGIGATSGTMKVTDGDLYRVEVVASDEAGNETASSFMVITPSYGEGGCSIARGGATGLPLLLMFAGLIAIRRRRR